ncbi:MAG: proline dehydrogenase family protein [Candidatus Micrarchaeota archaeon]
MPVKEKIVEIGANVFRRAWTQPTIGHGIKKARKLERAGGGAILNILGEHHDQEADVLRDEKKYRDLVDAIADAKVTARISIKPTQFGYDLGKSEYASVRTDYLVKTRDRMWSIVDYATRKGIKVEIDMEHSGTHDFTFETFRGFCRKLTQSGRGGMLGLAVQANYDRSIGDVEQLAKLDEKTYGRLRLRLVKGIYTPAKGDRSAFGPEEDQKTLANYRKLIDISAEAKNIDISVGTHRNDILQYALGKHVPIEEQALAGIRYPFKVGLRRQGISVWDYVPIGSGKAAGAYASRRATKAMQLGWRTFTDFMRPAIWKGTWLPSEHQKKKK